jgi:xanthine dehydrogenase small subunit
MGGDPAEEPGSVVLNGSRTSLAGVDAHTNVLDWVRSQGLTGAKEACSEGECGACAVLVARPGVAAPTSWTAVNACVIPALALAGQEVVTVEGLGRPDALHPVQRELARGGGSQCGFCTPGFVCSMAAEYYRPDRSAPGSHAVAPPGSAGDVASDGFDLAALDGNLCRCTGYRPIRDAALGLGLPEAGDPFARRLHEPPPTPSPSGPAAQRRGLARPADLSEALALLEAHPGAVAVAGSTDWGVAVNHRGARAPLLVAIDHVPELRELSVDDTCFTLGAGLTLTELEQRLAGRIPMLAELMPRFASRLIRNAATLGGNLATASPIGDAAPTLLALDAQVVLASSTGRRVVGLAEFFTGYRRTVMRPGELIVAVQVPRPLAGVTSFEKVSKRRTDDISSVAVAIALDLADERVRGVRIGLGGVAATPIRARATEVALLDRAWDAETVRAAAAVLAAEGTPIDDHRASAAYRRAMLGQALRRLHDRTVGQGGQP